LLIERTPECPERKSISSPQSQILFSGAAKFSTQAAQISLKLSFIAPGSL